MPRIQLTLACGDYEITRALKEGEVRPDGIDLTVLTEMDSSTRHWRFLRNAEFDIAECSASGYLAARSAGLPFSAIPVFPHRRFRHGFIYINSSSGIRHPSDLSGRKVGVKSYLVTAGLWIRGILKQEYGVAPESIHWLSELDEDVNFDPPAGLTIETIPHGKSIEDMLAEGEIDALIHPDLIEGIRTGDKRIGRLFPDFKQDEIAWFEKTGIFPIMHVVGIRSEIIDKYPWVPASLYLAFDRAKSIAMERMQNPRIVPLAWYRNAWEEQESVLGTDPWEYGLTDRNRKNIEALVGFSHEQGLIERPLGLDELFWNVSQGRKRGRGSKLF